MTVVKSLSGMNQPYTREQQCAVKPLPPLREKGKQGYADATARATNAQGQIICESCGKALRDGEHQRHHIKKRSQLGGNEASNLLIVCLKCHEKKHGGKR